MNTADRGGVCDLVLVSRTRSAEEKFCSAGPADASIEGRTDSAVPLSCPEIRGFRAAVLRVRIHLPPAKSLQTFGPLASREVRTPDPAAILSSSADFPVSPVIRPTLLRRFRAGTRRASPVAQHVLVTVPSLPPRRGEQPSRSVFGCSCCLRPSEVGSALGATFFEATTRSLLIQPGDS